MGKFSELVQNTYEKEAKERLTLENELKRLQALNTQLHSDAKALTDALAGTRNKTQGNPGRNDFRNRIGKSPACEVPQHRRPPPRAAKKTAAPAACNPTYW